MSPTISPRLPGVPLLLPHSTGPEYSRWRRSIKFALETKDLWKYCNGKCPMPMPEAGPNVFPPTASTTNLQPSLLDERRAWVKQDREVKLDIFLSLTEETMHEVFEVGPPLPPTNLSAQQMIHALDKRYAVFSFEAYHHAFCHFLNLHVDQYRSIQEFNREFSATLEDLVDHGHPLSNIQACSAYFSKLRCTQNPWVAKKLEEWDTHSEDVGVLDLIKESPPWFLIQPLASNPSQTFCVDSFPEEHLEDSDQPDSDTASEPSRVSTGSSISQYSRQISNTTAQAVQSPDVQRQLSISTTRSQEITVHVSTDITDIEPLTFRKHLKELPSSAIPERGNSKNQVLGAVSSDNEAPEWLSAKKSIALQPLAPPPDRPLPALPSVRSRSASPPMPTPRVVDISISPPASTETLTKAITHPQVPTPGLEFTYPSLRPTTPITDIHPALRNTPPSSAQPPTPPPSAAIPWPSTPDLSPRPDSPGAILPLEQTPPPPSSQAQVQTHTPRLPQGDLDADTQRRKLSTTSSADDLALPLQGTRDSAWAYLYESKGGYLVRTAPHSASRASPLSTSSSTTQSRNPAFDDSVLRVSRGVSPSPAPSHAGNYAPPSSAVYTHAKSASLDFVLRRSGDGVFGGVDVGREKERQRKKNSWSVGVAGGLGLGRVMGGRGVREII